MIIFGFIFIYIIISIALYIFSAHISVYEVKKGKLATDYKFHGFVIKEETVVKAKESGNITYYARDGEKVGCMSLVYSLDETGKLSKLLQSGDDSSSKLDKKDLKELQTNMADYCYTYSNINFDNVYDFKYDVEEKIISSINLNALVNISEYTEDNGTNNLIKTYKADAAGMIIYSTDGYEDVTTDNFKYSYLDASSYQKVNLNSTDIINAGDIVYKLITSENWNLMIEIDKALAEKLAETENIEVKFLKDGATTWAGIDIIKKDGKIQANLSFTNSLVRYAADRYLDIELQINDEEGLKIPVSSITEKEFYTIPLEYVTRGGDTNKEGFLIEKYDENQIASAEFTTTTIYYSDDKVCYVDPENFNLGDSVIKPDSSDRYQIGETASLVGVYSLNKGYASFRQIEILAKNEEYCIIRSGTDYGLALHDFIALDSDTVDEDDIIH